MGSSARALALLLLVISALPTVGCARRVRVTRVSTFASAPAPAAPPFYAELYAYGSWEVRASVSVFVPYDPGYAPYRDGYWAWDESYGMTWVAVGDPIGAIACHHGRWVHEGRWVWIPDDVWGPAWVDWREDEGSIGWAPLGPDGYGAAGWIDCPPGALFDPPDRRRRAAAPRGRRRDTPTATWLRDRGVVVRPARDRARTAYGPAGRELAPPAPPAGDPRGRVRDDVRGRSDPLAEAERARRDAEARARRDAEIQRRLAEADQQRRAAEARAEQARWD
ncbi:MAG: DUF6600 domain-containing protein, partial [Sandaracinaceae bacterium]